MSSTAIEPRRRGRTPRPYEAPASAPACADAPQSIAVVASDAMSAEVLAHLDAQIASVGRLLEIVLEQGAAIRARDVHTVVRLAGLLHGELTRRAQIEQTRARLLERAGARLGLPAAEVTLTRMSALMDPACAGLAAERSATLRGLVGELRREHMCNRALMQVELSFLNHLLRSLSLDASTHSYDPRGTATTGARAGSGGALRVLDLQA
ncbi:MAG TPA: flagellar export chaperone FlgN [Solirubrobacteraceae bacterium]|jgi:hypothetical protein|nr:flagellar export chaperone FlgN [Solirubrobacteraceae bacterium]